MINKMYHEAYSSVRIHSDQGGTVHEVWKIPQT